MIRKTVVWLTCMLYILAAPLAASASVICIGEDGHISIEKSVNGSCSSLHLEHHPEISLAEKETHEYLTDTKIKQLAAQDSHCGPCTDLTLTQLGTSTYNTRDDGSLQTDSTPLDVPTSFTNYLAASKLSQLSHNPIYPCDNDRTIAASIQLSVVLLI